MMQLITIFRQKPSSNDVNKYSTGLILAGYGHKPRPNTGLSILILLGLNLEFPDVALGSRDR